MEGSLQEAVLHGDCKKLQDCLIRGVSLEERVAALKEVCFLGHVVLVPSLLEGVDIDVNEEYEDGFTLLSIACSQGYSQIVEELLNQGARVDQCKKNGWSPLMIASKNGHADVVKTLLKHDAQVDLHKKSGRTALMIASQNGHSEVVNILLENHAKVNLQMEDGSSALILASRNGYSEVVKLLLENDAQLNLQVMHNSSTTQSHQDNHEGACGWTALEVASGKGHSEVIELLQKYSAQVDPQSISLPEVTEEVSSSLPIPPDKQEKSQDSSVDQEAEKSDCSSSDLLEEGSKNNTSYPIGPLANPQANVPELGGSTGTDPHRDLSKGNSQRTNDEASRSTIAYMVPIVVVFLGVIIIILRGPITSTLFSATTTTSAASSTVQLVPTPSIVTPSRSLTSKPQMMDLIHMKSKGHEDLRVLQEIEQDCKNLGYLLGIKDTMVNNIWKKSLEPSEKCEEIIREWLGGKGKPPITWKAFIDVLEKIQLLELVDRLRQELK